MSTSEVIHCPNCNEDVPKTLYCLNCGYPLYKLEGEKKAEKAPVAEVAPEPEPEVEVDMSVEYEPPSETFIEEPELTPEPEPTPEPEVIDDPEPEPEVEVDMSVVYEPPSETFIEEPELTPEPEPEVEIEVEETSENVWEAPEEEEPDEEPAPEPIPEQVVEEEPEPVIDVTVEPEVELELADEQLVITPEEREEYMMNDMNIDFAPDPLTKEVMENLAKNITLKIRLTKLLRENAVKEETFKKLFDSYVEQGRLWVSRKDEIIRRFKADMERMEQELVSARKDYELLEIRKNIGDAGENEYNVKAPAYKWDIEHLDSEIKTCSGGIQYMINLKALVPEEEVALLEKLSETNYSEVDSIEGVTSDTIAKMKETLEEALNTLMG